MGHFEATLPADKNNINMMILALLLPALVAGFPGGDHHGDGHEDGCVDISRYSDILYNVTEASICSYVSRRTCVKRKRSACVSVPIKTCRAVAYPDCSNENCRDVTFEDCKLKDVPTPIQVPKYVCTDLPVETYSVPVFAEVDVTGYRGTCQVGAYADCTETSETVCADLEFEECSDIIEPNCFPMCMDDGTCGTMKFRIPYQTYDHRLKCLF